jgi:hypothetical protein
MKTLCQKRGLLPGLGKNVEQRMIARSVQDRKTGHKPVDRKCSSGSKNLYAQGLDTPIRCALGTLSQCGG